MTTLDLESAAALLGISLAVLKTLGGWASMDMVMRYSHLAPEHVSEWAGNAEKVKVKRKRRAA